jgi:tRNA1(Val) A37 N6-methylase TrmN6
MDYLARYYTEEIVSNLLVKEITYSNPKIIVDLGIGGGSLTIAAHRKWKSATFIGTDIDHKQISETQERLPFVRIIKADGLNKNINLKLNLKVGSIDIAICNPPYLKIPVKSSLYMDLFKSVGLTNCNKLKYLTSDLIFLAQNLLLLKEGGMLGIILPDGLITSEEFRWFRFDLINSHTILSVIQLPDNIFKKADARTHIVILKKSKNVFENDVNLCLVDRNGVYVESLYIPCKYLIDRCDFFYNKLHISKIFSTRDTKTLVEIGADIKRGQLTKLELQALGIKYVHTTNLVHLSKVSLSCVMLKEYHIYVHTDKNDILLARVGRGCIGKVSFVKEGNQLLSDCVYRIRVPRIFLKKVWNSLCSTEGQLWIKAHSHGVCARLISKRDLLNFPIKL